MRERFHSVDELHVLVVFVDYQQAMESLELLKKASLFTKVIPTPREVLAAASLSIALREADLPLAQEIFRCHGIFPLKVEIREQCVLQYGFQV